jgi:hypothetical protein
MIREMEKKVRLHETLRAQLDALKEEIKGDFGSITFGETPPITVKARAGDAQLFLDWYVANKKWATTTIADTKVLYKWLTLLGVSADINTKLPPGTLPTDVADVVAEPLGTNAPQDAT